MVRMLILTFLAWTPLTTVSANDRRLDLLKDLSVKAAPAAREPADQYLQAMKHLRDPHPPEETATRLRAVEKTLEAFLQAEGDTALTLYFRWEWASELQIRGLYGPAIRQFLVIDRSVQSLPPESSSSSMRINVKVYLADCYMQTGELDQCVRVLREGLALNRAIRGPDSLETAQCQYTLAKMLIRMHKLDGDTYELIAECIKIREKHLPILHPDVLQANGLFAEYGLLITAAGQRKGTPTAEINETLSFVAKCSKTVVEGFELNKVLLKPGTEPYFQICFLLPEARMIYGQVLLRQRETDAAREQFEKMVMELAELMGANHDLVIMKLAWLALVDAKTGQWEKSVERFDRIRRNYRQQAITRLGSLSNPQQQAFLANVDLPAYHTALSLVLLKPDHQQIVDRTAEWAINGKSVTAEMLSLRSNELPPRWVTLDKFRETLPQGSAFITFVKLLPFDLTGDGSVNCWSREPRYVAWIVLHDGKIRAIDLGPADPIDQNLVRFHGTMANAQDDIALDQVKPAAKRASTILTELREQLIAPLEAHIREHSHWILSPDSGLWMLPFEALPEGDGFLIETRQIDYATSGRDRVGPAVPRSSNPGLVLADPDFNKAPPGQRSDRPVPDDPFPHGLQAVHSPSAGLNAIRSRVQARTGRPADYLTGADAQEIRIQAMRAPSHVVLITHGHSVLGPRPQVPPNDAYKLLAEDGNPLERTAIFLAGANRRLENQLPASANGVWTGAEIAQLNWRGCELVMLTSCDSAAGRIQPGEGTADLRRAFQIAGAESVIAALWKIPAEESVAVTARFWQHYADPKVSASKALMLAKRDFIKTLRNRDGVAHPYYWAALTSSSRR